MLRRLFSTFGLLILTLIVLVSTLVIDRLFQGARIDLTENSIYTLSSGSKQIAANLQQPLTLKLFFSREATRDALGLRNYAKRVRELLEEFELAAKGKIALQVIDPEPFSEAEDEAAGFGLQAIDLGVVDPVYFGLVVTGEQDRTQAAMIRFFQPDREAFLEYDIARVLVEASQPKKPQIAILSQLPVNGGFNMMSQRQTPAWMAIAQLQDLFDLQTLATDIDEISADTDLLVVIHPQDLPDSTRYAIDQFVLAGGRAIIFVDPFAEQQQTANMMMAQADAKQSSNLADLFSAWGLDYNPDKFVGDYQLALQVAVGSSTRPVKHLAILQLTESNRATNDDPIINQLETINLSTSGYLLPTDTASTQFEALLMSSEFAMPMATEKLRRLRDPSLLTAGFKPDGKRYIFAARLTGPAKTAFPKGVPIESSQEEVENQKDDGDKSDNKVSTKQSTGQQSGEKPNDQPATANTEQLESGEINVLVVADTDVLSDRLWVRVQQLFGQTLLQPFADNNAFFTNAVDYLSGSHDLISIRSRGRFTRPFTRVQSMNRKAEEAFQAQQLALQEQLKATESRLVALQNQRDDSGNLLTLSPEQEQELAKFRQQKISIRKQLRDVKHQLNRDIDALGYRLKLINIVLVPLLLGLLVAGIAWWRWRRR